MDSRERLDDLIGILQKLMESPFSSDTRREASERFTELLDSLQQEGDAGVDTQQIISILKKHLFHWFWERRARMFFRLKKRAQEAYVEDLIWGVKRFLRRVEPPLRGVPLPNRYRRWFDPTLREERLLSRYLDFQRRVMATHSEEGMRPEKRYFRIEVPFAAGRHDGKPVVFLSKEEAEIVERETKARSRMGVEGWWHFVKDADGNVIGTLVTEEAPQPADDVPEPAGEPEKDAESLEPEDPDDGEAKLRGWDK